MLNKKYLVVACLVGLFFSFALEVDAQNRWTPGDFGSVKFRLGLFEPDANSSYWNEKFEVWTGNPEDFKDLVWGVDYLWMRAPTWGIQFGSAWYQGSTTQAYRDWVEGNEQEIAHQTELSTWNLTAAWVYKPLHGSDVRPYFGLGIGLVSWRLLEYGDFIDFGSPSGDEIVYGNYRDTGTTFLALGFVGVEFFSRSSWSLFIEGRWNEAETSLGGGFSSLNQRLDLSGPEVSAGFAWKF